MPHEVRAALACGHRGLGRPAAPGPFLGDADRCDPRVAGMLAPGVWLTAPPALPTPCIVGPGLLRIGSTSKPPRCHVLDLLGAALGVLGLGGGLGPCRLLGQLARVDHDKASLGHGKTPGSGLHGPAADDTVPLPASRRLLAGAPWLCQP